MEISLRSISAGDGIVKLYFLKTLLESIPYSSTNIKNSFC